MKYRYHGKEKTLSIGKYPAFSLVEARKKREEAKALLVKDMDPSQQKKEQKQRRTIEMTNSFRVLAKKWHSNNLPRWTPSHAVRVLNFLEADAFPMIGDYPITDIKAPLLLDAIRAIEVRGATDTAARVLQRIKAIFNYAIQTVRVIDNPALSLTGVVIRDKVTHQPALPQSELSEFYRRLLIEPMREETRIALLFIILTFVKAGNIRFAEWSEINHDNK